MVASALIWSFRFDFLGEEDKDSLCPSGILLFKVLKVFSEGSGIGFILPCRPFWKFAALRFVIPEIPTLNRPFLVFLIMLQTLLIVLHLFCELLSLQQLNIYKRSDILCLFGVNLIISDQTHSKASSTDRNCSSAARYSSHSNSLSYLLNLLSPFCLPCLLHPSAGKGSHICC